MHRKQYLQRSTGAGGGLDSRGAAMGRGVYHALALLMPHLDASSRAHLQTLAAAYLAP